MQTRPISSLVLISFLFVPILNRFLDRTPKGTDREGHTWGGTLPPPEDGFTKNTRYHGTTPKFDSTAILRSLDPYVSRYDFRSDMQLVNTPLYNLLTHPRPNVGTCLKLCIA